MPGPTPEEFEAYNAAMDRGEVTMHPAIRAAYRDSQSQLSIAIERKLQELIDAGVPRDRMGLRYYHGTYTIYVKSDDELWLDWLSANH